VGRTWNCWTLNMAVHIVTTWLLICFLLFVRQCVAFIFKPTRSFVRSGSTYPTIRRHIPEDCNSRLNRREKLNDQYSSTAWKSHSFPHYIRENIWTAHWNNSQSQTSLSLITHTWYSLHITRSVISRSLQNLWVARYRQGHHTCNSSVITKSWKCFCMLWRHTGEYNSTHS
jgi:hypothetical protein